MHTHYRVTDRSLACLLVTGLLVFGSTTANATYTVIDDDLYPTSVIEARATPPAPVIPDHYTVPFTKDHSPLTIASRAVLDTLLPQMRNESIRIIGRPDARIYTTGKMSAIARNRAINIRDYLTRQGVPSNRITIETDNSPNPQLNGNSYPCDIYITNTDSRASAPSPVPYAQPIQAVQAVQAVQAAQFPKATYQTYETTQTVAALPVATAANPASDRDRLVAFINKSILDGTMSPTVGLRLLRTLLGDAATEPSNRNVQTVAKAQPVPIVVKAAPTTIDLSVKATTERADTWEILPTDATLQDTFERWGKLANWTIHWEDVPPIRNHSFIKFPASDFFTIADQVLTQAKTAAKAAGIDLEIKAYPDRVIVISNQSTKHTK